MPNPRVGDVLLYRDDDPSDPEAGRFAVVAVSEHEVVMLLDGHAYGFSWRTFRALFVPSTAVAA